MKILIITQYFWPENFKINDFALRMKDRGHEIVVLTGLPNYPGGKIFEGYGYWKKRKDDYNGIKVIRSLLVPRGKSGGFRLVINYFSFAFFASLTGIFKIKGKFDIIFVYEPSPITIGIPSAIMRFIKKAPVCFWVQDLWPESVGIGKISSPLIYKFLRVLVKFVYDHSDILLISSSGFAESIKSFGIDDSKISFLPNWAEDYFKPLNKNIFFEHDYIFSSGFNLLFAGNIGEAQDFKSIISAAEKLRTFKDIKFIIVGDGRRFEWLKEEIKKRRLYENFTLAGRFPAKQMPYFFSRADALLVSLKKNYIFSLTIPSKLQTYMACAKPILAMLDGEGAKIVQESGAGLTCTSGDYEKLAENILKIYNMSESERNIMSNKALDYYIKNFDVDILMDKIENLFHTLSNTSKK